MADLTFLVEVILSIAAVAVPVGAILWFLVAGDFDIADLFIAPSWNHGNPPAVAEDEEAPRWHLEHLRPAGDRS